MHNCEGYLTELACRAVSTATPHPLPVDPERYECCKRECVPMLALVRDRPVLRAQLAAQSNLSESEPERLAEYARHHALEQRTDVTEEEYHSCNAARHLQPMITLLETNSPLQQRLAFALDYVPSRWLLGAEIPAVVMRRRLQDPTCPDLDESYRDVPECNGHRDAYAWARENKLTGLCLSGGGIRSATFNLGILQGLAALGVLGEFDYVSSVSGGGYIHQWLAAWIRREDSRSTEGQPEGTIPQGFKAVTDALRPVPVDAEHPFTPDPIRWLRRYSNYLTPRKGLFTADTWVAVAIWVRNTFLNQIILLSLLFSVVLVPQMLLRPRIRAYDISQYSLLWSAGSVLPFLCAVVVLCRGLRHELLRVRRADKYRMQNPPVEHALLGEDKAVLYIVIPLLATAFLVTHALALGVSRTPFLWALLGLIAAQLAGMALSGGVIPAYCVNHDLTRFLWHSDACSTEEDATSKTSRSSLAWRRIFQGMGDSLRFWNRERRNSLSAIWFRDMWKVLWGPILLGPIFGLAVLGSLFAALGAVGLFWATAALLHFPKFAMESLTFHLPVFLRSPDGLDAWRTQLTLGPPALVLVPFFAIVLMAGLVGRNFPDWLREWIARVRAWCLLLGLGWIAFFGLALFGPALVRWLGSDAHVYKKTIASIKWTAVLGWIATTAGGVLAGNSKKVSGTADDTSVGLKVAALVGPYVFLVGLLILLSSVADTAAVHCFGAGEGWYKIALVLVPPLLFGVFGWRVDVNEFSMNPFYRNRLTRCYLGATNAKRDPNPLTGLDDRDTRGLQVYKFQPAEGYSGPLPILNTTVNLSFGEDLAYQERKAASFFFSPLFSGYTVGWTSGKESGEKLSFNGFVPTRHYYSPDGGINIATAAAISGAAASPNWGFHTNPATAFLMTLFNVRLGWWIANPRRSALAGYPANPEHVKSEWPSPKFAPAQLLSELLGRTKDTSAYLYLSDGGHFDNMGLYELVRRRCHRIVICDAECDETYSFEGLGMAIRKCRIDFGVEILLNDISRLRLQMKTQNCKAHFVIGTIRYPESPLDSRSSDGRNARYTVGTVMYIKSSLTGDAKWAKDPKASPHTLESLDAETVDILNYRLQHKSFPNDTTGNQWFTESQFESYRRLGQHVVEEIKCSEGWNEFTRKKTTAGIEKTTAPLVVGGSEEESQDQAVVPVDPDKGPSSTPAPLPNVAAANGSNGSGA